MENSYLACFRSDFSEFCVYVIVVTSRIFLYTFQTVFLLVVYCSNYSPLFASCMIARMIVCCCLVLLIKFRREVFVGDQENFYDQQDQQDFQENFDQGKYS